MPSVKTVTRHRTIAHSCVLGAGSIEKIIRQDTR